MIPSPPRLARALAALRFAMEQQEPALGVNREDLPGLVLYHDRESVTAYPSSNPNRLEVTDPTLAAESLPRAVERYATLGVARFFCWVDPDASATLAPALQLAGFQPFTGTSYHVLARRAEPVELASPVFTIRQLGPEDAALGSCYGDEKARFRFQETLGVEGFEHFGAFAGDELAATARLFRHEAVAYLCDGGTREEWRNRGGQTALIGARINRAAALGCTLCVVQTLALLRTSLGNLRRAGFAPVYDREVWALG